MNEIETLTIEVVSHDPNLLEKVPEHNSLSRHLLSELDIPEAFQGEFLAENRFFLTNGLIESGSRFVGIASARWNDRFQSWPKLENMHVAIEPYSSCENVAFAPLAMHVSGRQAKAWILAQDSVHPGMSNILIDLMESLNLRIDDDEYSHVVMGNNFVVEIERAQDFLEFWQKSFFYIVDKHGLTPPFSYRCAKCGKTNDYGIGRWSATRHIGFLLERVSSLYFMTNSSLRFFDLSTSAQVKRTFKSFLFDIGPSLYKVFFTVVRFGRPCAHTHTPVGDI